MTKLPQRTKEGVRPQAYHYDPSTDNSCAENPQEPTHYSSIDKVVEVFGEELKESLKLYDFKGVKFVDLFEAFTNPYLLSGIATHLTLFIKWANVVVSPEARGFVIGPTLAAANGLAFLPFRKKGKLPFLFENEIIKVPVVSEYDVLKLECSENHIYSVKLNIKKMKSAQEDFKRVLEEKADESKNNEDSQDQSQEQHECHCETCHCGTECQCETENTLVSEREDVSEIKPVAVVSDDVLATGGTALAMVETLRSQGFIVNQALFIAELVALKGREILEAAGVEVKSIVKM